MNALQKSVFGGVAVLVAAYVIGHLYGEDILFKGLFVAGAVALLTLAQVRILLASLLQLAAHLIEGVGHGINLFGAWMVDVLDDYKQGQRALNPTANCRSNVPDWDDEQLQTTDRNEGLDILEPSEH